MKKKKRQLKLNPKPFSLDQFIAEQPNREIGPSKHTENLNFRPTSEKDAIDEAFYVINLMAESTKNVLNHTDRLSEITHKIKKDLHTQLEEKQRVHPQTLDAINHLHKVLIEMIASQSYQDVARQKMELVINNLKEAYQQLEMHNRSLEEKVSERTSEIAEKNTILKKTLNEVERVNKKIMDSIRYAQIIQTSILPAEKLFQELLPNSFNIWQPRDVVGGDLLILEKLHSGILIGIIDCTGHGVPGALMTMVASSELKRIVHANVDADPALILEKLNENIKRYLGLDGDQVLSDVGLDAALCFIDQKKQSMVYSGARIPLLYYDSITDKMTQIKGQKVSIGYKKSNREVAFLNHSLQWTPTSYFWLTTDGFTDQTNSTKRISWGSKRLMLLLGKIRLEPPKNQKSLILEAFNTYRGQKDVLDDVTMIGFSPFIKD